MLSLGLGLPWRAASGPVVVPEWVLASGDTSAAMDIDFRNNQAWRHPSSVAISALLACTRNSQKWVRNSTGSLVSFAANTVPYTNLGLLPEAAATNLFPRSQEFATANWNGSSNIVVTDNATAAPDGTTTADLITDSNTGTTVACHSGRTIVLSGAGNHVISIFAKAGTATRLRISTLAFDAGGVGDSYFDISAGTVLSQHANHANARVTAHTNGWYRCSLSFSTTSDLNGTVRFGLATSNVTTISSDGTKNFYLWQAQLETGTRASTIIPTTTAAATRPADIITFSNLTWFDGATDSFYAEWIARNVAGATVWAWDATNNKALDEQSGMSPRLAGATTANTVPVDSRARTSGRMALDDFGVCLEGGTVATDTSETAPGTLTASRLGCDLAGANHLGSFIHRVASFKVLFNDGTLQAMTAPWEGNIDSESIRIDNDIFSIDSY